MEKKQKKQKIKECKVISFRLRYRLEIYTKSEQDEFKSTVPHDFVKVYKILFPKKENEIYLASEDLIIFNKGITSKEAEKVIRGLNILYEDKCYFHTSCTKENQDFFCLKICP